MNGNIVFGFFYLAATAVLGPKLLVPNLGEGTKAFKETAQVVGKVSEGVPCKLCRGGEPGQGHGTCYCKHLRCHEGLKETSRGGRSRPRQP